MFAGSEPASTSVSANAEIAPLASRGKYLRFCSSVPNSFERLRHADRLRCRQQRRERAALRCHQRHCPHVGERRQPQPAVFRGILMPNAPIARSSSTTTPGSGRCDRFRRNRYARAARAAGRETAAPGPSRRDPAADADGSDPAGTARGTARGRSSDASTRSRAPPRRRRALRSRTPVATGSAPAGRRGDGRGHFGKPAKIWSRPVASRSAAPDLDLRFAGRFPVLYPLNDDRQSLRSLAVGYTRSLYLNVPGLTSYCNWYGPPPPPDRQKPSCWDHRTSCSLRPPRVRNPAARVVTAPSCGDQRRPRMLTVRRSRRSAVRCPVRCPAPAPAPRATRSGPRPGIARDAPAPTRTLGSTASGRLPLGVVGDLVAPRIRTGAADGPPDRGGARAAPGVARMSSIGVSRIGRNALNCGVMDPAVLIQIASRCRGSCGRCRPSRRRRIASSSRRFRPGAAGRAAGPSALPPGRRSLGARPLERASDRGGEFFSGRDLRRSCWPHGASRLTDTRLANAVRRSICASSPPGDHLDVDVSAEPVPLAEQLEHLDQVVHHLHRPPGNAGGDEQARAPAARVGREENAHELCRA